MHENPSKNIWLLAEQTQGRLRRVSYELITRGLELAAKRKCELVAVLFGSDVSDAELQTLIDRGVDRVIYTQADALAEFDLEPYAACLLELIAQERPEIFLAGATSTGRTLMPYVAIKAHAGLTADCTVLDIDEETGNLLQTRPAIGGNILATIQTPDHRPQMATVRPRSTRPAEPVAGRTGEIVRRRPDESLLASRVTRIGLEPFDDEKGIEEADAIVAVGRGIKKMENLPLIEALAEQLDAAIGASRDVIDRGWLSYPHQIGLSGKTVTPKLYVGVGVSGSIQHLAGMQTAETIIAINNDPEAQIFQVADVGIVGDLFEVVPALTAALKEARRP